VISKVSGKQKCKGNRTKASLLFWNMLKSEIRGFEKSLARQLSWTGRCVPQRTNNQAGWKRKKVEACQNSATFASDSGLKPQGKKVQRVRRKDAKVIFERRAALCRWNEATALRSSFPSHQSSQGSIWEIRGSLNGCNTWIRPLHFVGKSSSTEFTPEIGTERRCFPEAKASSPVLSIQCIRIGSSGN